MAPKKRDLSDSESSDSSVFGDAEARKHGNALLVHLQALYATGKLSARDFCIACWHCKGAKVPGAEWDKFSLNPDHQSGKYQYKLDRVLSPPTLVMY